MILCVLLVLNSPIYPTNLMFLCSLVDVAEEKPLTLSNSTLVTIILDEKIYRAVKGRRF